MTVIAEVIEVGGSPGAPSGRVEPREGEYIPVMADLGKEYVSGGYMQWYLDFIQALSWDFDDLTGSLGDDIYDKMMLDPQIASCVNVLKIAILASGLRLSTAKVSRPVMGIADPTQLDLLSTQIRDFCEDVIDDLITPIEDVLWGMLDALPYGNKIAELVYEIRDIEGVPMLPLKDIKVKPRRTVAFVVDTFKNVVGIIGMVPGIGYTLQQGTMMMTTPDNMLPLEKFFTFSFRPKDSDPRGTSILRPAHTSWWMKMQTMPELLRYLALFAMPGLIGTTPENAMDAYDIDPTTGEIIPETRRTAQQALLDNLISMKNGSAAAFPFGTKIQLIEPEGNGGGEAFQKAVNLFDKQISKGITNQTLATEEGEHQARASSATQMTVLQGVIRQIKKGLERAVYRDVLKPMVRYNFGDEAAKLTPRPSLGEVDQSDLTSLAIAVGQLFNGKYIDPSQLADLDRKMGLTPRTPEEVAARLQAAGVQIPTDAGDVDEFGEDDELENPDEIID